MSKKIIIKVEVCNEKCRSKARKIAAPWPGVSSTSMEGDQLVVTGKRIDSFELEKKLRKDVGLTTLVSMEDVEAKEEDALSLLPSIFKTISLMTQLFLRNSLKKKIIIELEVRNEKCRTNAKKIAAAWPGVSEVSSMSLEGIKKEQLVVIGERIDSFKLVKKLKENVGPTTIVSMKDVVA